MDGVVATKEKRGRLYSVWVQEQARELPHTPQALACVNNGSFQ